MEAEAGQTPSPANACSRLAHTKTILSLSHIRRPVSGDSRSRFELGSAQDVDAHARNSRTRLCSDQVAVCFSREFLGHWTLRAARIAPHSAEGCTYYVKRGHLADMAPPAEGRVVQLSG